MFSLLGFTPPREGASQVDREVVVADTARGDGMMAITVQPCFLLWRRWPIAVWRGKLAARRPRGGAGTSSGLSG